MCPQPAVVSLPQDKEGGCNDRSQRTGRPNFLELNRPVFIGECFV